MLFRSYIPCAALREFIDDFWLYENYAAEHQKELILPSGTCEMVFNLQEDELRIYSVSDPSHCSHFAGALISGPYAGSFVSDTREESGILGVHFKPGGAPGILRLPTRDLRNIHIDLKTIWGPAGTALRDRLCSLNEPTDKFRLLEQVFMERISPRASRHAIVRVALDLLMRSHGQVKTRDIAKAVSLSQRRFIELFTAEVGLGPKLFGRIQRFQYAVTRFRNTRDISWAQLAVECGYFDQSHLISDFVEFVGLSPGNYWHRQSSLDRAGTHVKRHHLPLAG
jgi:AraC-like DNA-binding protein